MEKKNGERPITGMFDGCFMVESGLTKREYFAGLALQGLLACHNIDATGIQIVELSLKYADELLKQLEDGK